MQEKKPLFYVVASDPSKLYQTYGRIRAYGTLSSARKEVTRSGNKLKAYAISEVQDVQY
jgi:hypothetical protein